MQAVLETEQPENLQLLRTFVGLGNNYRKFIPRLASVAPPLYHLWKKEAPWRWISNQKESWKLFKEFAELDLSAVRIQPDSPFDAGLRRSSIWRRGGSGLSVPGRLKASRHLHLQVSGTG